MPDKIYYKVSAETVELVLDALRYNFFYEDEEGATNNEDVIKAYDALYAEVSEQRESKD